MKVNISLMRRYSSLLGILILGSQISPFLLSQPAVADPVVCAIPGIDGPENNGPVVNTYFGPSPSSTTLNAGANSVSLSSYYTAGANADINPGDMLMIIQMQDASINATNSNQYGSGTAANDGRGHTGLGNSGVYEFVYATNSVPATTGGTLTFSGAGTGGGLLNSYVNDTPTATRGRRTFQVIRMVQYSSLTLTSNITVPDWNGQVGGVIALDIAGDMNFGGYAIDGSAKGFRGGFTPVGASGANLTDYVYNTNTQQGGGKGEGIAGTPHYLWDGTTSANLGSDQLPGGDGGRGAPGNAGGGGNDHNAGGGGGSNGGAGGRGGNGWAGAGGGSPSGGQGASVTTPPSIGRLIMGGGGGGGDANNALTGVPGGQGGGVVMIRANRFVGSGTIRVNGTSGDRGAVGSAPDGAGGGGAGGTVAIFSTDGDLSGITVEAIGGDGGNTANDRGNEHGPGGGGGGGVVLSYSPTGQVPVGNLDLSGGDGGQADDGLGIPFGAEDGVVGDTETFTPATLPLISPGAECFPTLTTVKTEAVPGDPGKRLAPGTASYTITVSNSGPGGAAGVRVHDTLPAGFTVPGGGTATATFTGGAYASASTTGTGTPPTSVSVSNSGTNTAPSFGDFVIPSGGTASVTFTVDIADGTTPGTYQNPAYASYLDPTRTSADLARRITPVDASLSGANVTYSSGSRAGENVPGSNYDSASSMGEDVVIYRLEPSVLLVKRITAINASTSTMEGDDLAVYKDETDNFYDDNTLTTLEPTPPDTDQWPDPTTNLVGGTDGGNVVANDEIDYTIYYLSSGDAPAEDVLFCDYVPTFTSFVPNAYNGSTPQANGGIGGADLSIELFRNGGTDYHTGANDGDRAIYFAPGEDPASSFPGIDCDGDSDGINANPNGAVVVSLGDLPDATTNATGAYGYVRFRARVK